MKNSLGRHLFIASILTVLSTFVIYVLISGIEVGNFKMKGLFDLTVPATAESARIDMLFEGHWWAISFLFSLITVFMLYAIFAFKREEGDEGEGMYMHGNTPLEIAWTVLPIIPVVAFAWWGGTLLTDLVSNDQDEAAIVIDVEGYKWGWTFSYPDGEESGANATFLPAESIGVPTGTLHLPKDRPVLLRMESRDVLHSFWIPEFRVKQDLLPGRKTYLRFTPSMSSEAISAAHNGDEAYTVQVRCAEICGTSHAYMLAPVRVYESDTEFLAAMELLDDLPTEPVARGEYWHSADGHNCVSCHSIDGSDGTGPTWKGIIGREAQFEDGTPYVIDAEYIRNSIYYPNEQIVSGYLANQMPNNYEQLFGEREQQAMDELGMDFDTVDDIIAFMETLTE